MTTLFLMAGASTAFPPEEYIYPKNLVEICGQPLIQRVISSFADLIMRSDAVVFMISREENRKYHTASVIELLCPKGIILEVSQNTAGAACTSLLAIEYLCNDNGLFIINGDIVVDNGIEGEFATMTDAAHDGCALVFESVHPRWSYVKCDSSGFVVEAAEKRPISNMATAGVNYFAKASDFVSAAKQMILKDAKTDGKFFVCPVYNELVLMGKKITTVQIEFSRYFTLATPRGVNAYSEYLRGSCV